jgi:hypothetical protein
MAPEAITLIATATNDLAAQTAAAGLGSSRVARGLQEVSKTQEPQATPRIDSFVPTQLNPSQVENANQVWQKFGARLVTQQTAQVAQNTSPLQTGTVALKTVPASSKGNEQPQLHTVA